MPKSIEDKLWDLEKRNDLITDNLIDAVWVVEAKTLQFEYITKSIEKISGYSPGEYIGKTVQERLGKKALNVLLPELRREIQFFEDGRRKVRNFELELVDEAGNSYWVELRLTFVKESNGSIKIAGITSDITPRKREQHKKDDLNEKLAITLAEKERLLKKIKVLHKLLPICSGVQSASVMNQGGGGRWRNTSGSTQIPNSPTRSARIARMSCIPSCKKGFFQLLFGFIGDRE